MSNKAYNRLLFIFGFLICALAVLQLRTQSELTTTLSDIRFARGMVRTFQNYRSVALSGDAKQAVNALEMLQEPVGGQRFHNAIADFVERERKESIKNVIDYLRMKTGRDYGEDPQKWIEAMKANVSDKK